MDSGLTTPRGNSSTSSIPELDCSDGERRTELRDQSTTRKGGGEGDACLGFGGDKEGLAVGEHLVELVDKDRLG